MKLNWGTGVVLAFIGFIGFILFFVVQMSMNNKSSHELVTKDYYKKELEYQKEINAQNNAAADNVRLYITKVNKGIRLQFPKDVSPHLIKGTVSFYRPSNEHLDFDLPIRLSNSHLLIPDERLLGGRWDITVSWEYQGEAYLHKERIIY
ncbi:FixH family protein [Maribacter sp. 2304DJ31-5]|uniref:FixH family protein n=1 Tax=Maribacter sp. 2304DJ31-5 TaxID=3386273 RepID=UPI0039BC8E22